MVAVQPFASVTVYVAVPADAVNEPVPVYDGVPPLADTLTVVDPPKQAIEPADADATTAVG